MPNNTTTAGSNGHPLETVPRPTGEDIDRLFAVAESCHESKAVFGSQLRRIMALGGDVRISKKFLRESMTISQFDAAIAYYERLGRVLIQLVAL
jgi:hypothetical protein